MSFFRSLRERQQGSLRPTSSSPRELSSTSSSSLTPPRTSASSSSSSASSSSSSASSSSSSSAATIPSTSVTSSLTYAHQSALTPQSPHRTAFAQQRFRKQARVSKALVRRLRRVATLREHRGCVNTASWSDCGRFLISGSDEGRACIWDYHRGPYASSSTLSSSTSSASARRRMRTASDAESDREGPKEDHVREEEEEEEEEEESHCQTEDGSVISVD
mmetsp:Transcript_18827/g.47885  ORF Transcript_18827/g.47885 Transcript_18827/m.47885 type:complete len:219 (-) Transcript_18827:1187-1843(-)